MKKLILLLIVLATGAGAYTTSVAQITGSAHDFSGEVWSGGEICLPCHTPHNADTTVSDSPLWNHEVTTAIFTVYSSPTLEVTPGQPTGVSKLCLSCHDGTVALDSFGGTAGTVFISPSASLTTDLSDDHPVCFDLPQYNGADATHHDDTPICSNCHFSGGGVPWASSPSSPRAELPFFDRRLECATCHDAHNTLGLMSMLRKTVEGSAICLHCHNK